MTTDMIPDIGRQPSYGLQRSTVHNINKTQFGDGYEQRRPDGINTNRRIYSVTWGTLSKSQYDTLYEFLSGRKGVYAFLWPVPDSGELVKVVAEEISDTYTAYNRYTLTCRLREVFE